MEHKESTTEQFITPKIPLKTSEIQRNPVITRNQFSPLFNEMTTDNAELKTEEVNEQETNLPFNMNQRNFNNNKQKNSRRPSLIINQHPENDITPRKLKTVPGNCTYGDAVRYGKKTYIVGTSHGEGN